MVNWELQKYWALVSAHRRGNQGALVGLKLLANGTDRGAQLARLYVLAKAS